jgi:hypothetical protein
MAVVSRLATHIIQNFDDRNSDRYDITYEGLSEDEVPHLTWELEQS